MRSVTASAPARCGIVGNPSDIYGGYVVSCSVPVRNRCTVRDQHSVHPVDDDLLWQAARRRMPIPEPAEVEWVTLIPRSHGLSGSTALLAATLACLARFRDEEPDLTTGEGRTRFAELVRDVEAHGAGIICGYQDAQMIVHGGLQAMDFAGKHPLDGGPLPQVEPLPAPQSLPFLLVSTGVERLSGSVHGPIRDRWLRGERAVVSAMEHLATLARAGGRALSKQDWDTLARAMHENHRYVAELGGSGEAIDRLVKDCRRAGALAAKLAGAGLGGTVIALTESPDSLQRSLTAMGYTRFLRPAIEPGLRYE